MIVEAYLELSLPDLKILLEDDELEVEMRLQEDPDIECRLEPEISISAHISGIYELEG